MQENKAVTGLSILLLGLALLIYSSPSEMELTEKSEQNIIKDAEMRGTVIDAVTKQAVADADIMIPLVGKATKTNRQGEFIFQNLRPGTYKVLFVHVDYPIDSTSVKLNNGQTKQLKVKLKPE